MGITPDLNPLLDHLRDVVIPEGITGDAALGVLRTLLMLRGVVDHLAATATGALDRLGWPPPRGGRYGNC